MKDKLKKTITEYQEIINKIKNSKTYETEWIGNKNGFITRLKYDLGLTEDVDIEWKIMNFGGVAKVRLKKTKYTTHIVVNPDGELVGPIGTVDFVKKALAIGYNRITENKKPEAEVLKIITEMGYKIYKADIILKERVA